MVKWVVKYRVINHNIAGINVLLKTAEELCDGTTTPDSAFMKTPRLGHKHKTNF